jgi:hypothetical protein
MQIAGNQLLLKMRVTPKMGEFTQEKMFNSDVHPMGEDRPAPIPLKYPGVLCRTGSADPDPGLKNSPFPSGKGI